MRPNVEEQRSILGWAGKDRTAIDDHGAREVDGSDFVPEPPHEPIRLLVEVPCIEPAIEPSDLAAPCRTARPRGIVGPEDLRQVMRFSGLQFDLYA
jgi:hypothetical protein